MLHVHVCFLMCAFVYTTGVHVCLGHSMMIDSFITRNPVLEGLVCCIRVSLAGGIPHLELSPTRHAKYLDISDLI